MNPETFRWFLIIMAGIALVVFIALYYVKAGYGIFFDKKWGIAINNKIGWLMMEAPVFLVMLGFWYFSCFLKYIISSVLLFILFY